MYEHILNRYMIFCIMYILKYITIHMKYMSPCYSICQHAWQSRGRPGFNFLPKDQTRVGQMRHQHRMEAQSKWYLSWHRIEQSGRDVCGSTRPGCCDMEKKFEKTFSLYKIRDRFENTLFRCFQVMNPSSGKD